jgi:hypothetical protein
VIEKSGYSSLSRVVSEILCKRLFSTCSTSPPLVS